MLESILKNTLVVIPARGGSKRIPKKNITDICGQPMIYWPLRELQRIFKSENIIVSTDSEEIKITVEQKGLSVPFLRPERLSDDFTPTIPVIQHALDWYESNIKKIDFVLTVYPTAVLLDAQDICAAAKILAADNKCNTVLSATTFAFPIQRAVFENKSGYAEMFNPEFYSTRSQDLVEAKHDAGQFDFSRAETIRQGTTLVKSKVKLHLLPRHRVIDIDTPEDLEIAVEKIKIQKKELLHEICGS